MIQRRAENGRDTQVLSDEDRLSADEFRFQRRFAVLEEHRDDFAKIGVQLIERLALRMRAAEARNVSDVETRVGVPLGTCQDFCV